MSEFLLEYVGKFHSKEKYRVIFAMEILLETNAKSTWNFSYGKNFKLPRKDSDPSYLRVGTLFIESKKKTKFWRNENSVYGFVSTKKA
jgi:hypothetical protein